MKIQLSLLLFAFCFLPLLAQAQCFPPAKYTVLDANNISALFKTNGSHFFRENAEFEVPKGSGKTTFFAASLWLGAKDKQDNLHLAAMRYAQIGNDYWTGPVSNSGAEAGNYYDKFWKVSQEQIDNHILHYEDPGYIVPDAIANWPAHGRSEYGESEYLAPYVNVSGDSIYSPAKGDYPLIRGDVAIFWINNDVCGTHSESKGIPLGVQILSMAYAYNSTDEALNNTIFLSYAVRNKSNNNYHDFYAGLFADFDIGYSSDDYIGCDSSLNLCYGYNGKEVDGAGEPWAYGSHPPAQGAMFLNQKMSTFMYFNNNGSEIGDPRNAIEYYNFLQGKWKDGTPLTYGGIGYNKSSSDYTNFAFSGDPATETGWTEVTPDGPGSSPNKPDDRRGMMSTGPFTLNARECIFIDIAFPYARDPEATNLTVVPLLKQRAAQIQQYYDNQSYEFDCPFEVYIPQLCEKPVELLGNADENSVSIFWNEPANIDGELLGYNIYRDAIKIDSTLYTVKEYKDENLDNGTYSYQISAVYEHCESELSDEISLNITVGTTNNKSVVFNIFPNPATNELIIEMSDRRYETYDIKIYDVYGRMIVIPVGAQRNEKSRTINISHLPAGIYFVKIYSEENQIVVKKLGVSK